MNNLNFNYDAYQLLDTPKLYLATPAKRIIGALQARDVVNDFGFADYSTLEFTMTQFTNNSPTPLYDKVDIGYYVYMEGITWFRITNVERNDNGQNTTLSVTAYTLEVELGNTFITSMGEMGTEDDEQGGLDLYSLNDPNNPNQSIRHLIESKNPAWKFKYIDSSISNEKRSYSESRVSSYDLLTSTVAEALECVFVFDGNDRTISAYSLESLDKQTSIFLSLRNLIKEVNASWNEDDIRTVFYVTGGDDTTGSALMINTVNPAGNNYISNFSYYYRLMSEELQNKLIEYDAKIEENQPLYVAALKQLQVLLNEKSVLLDQHPTDDEFSTDWSKHGLNQLKSKQASYNDLMSTYVEKIKSDPTVKAEYDKYTRLYNEVSDAITERENDIKDKEEEITNQQELIRSLTVNLQDFLGEELYHELSFFVKEETYDDTTFIATDKMSASEIIDMQQQLMGHAIKELERVAFPRFEMTVDAINFPNIFKYKEYTDQLDLGAIVNINYEKDNFVKARVLAIHFNWSDKTDFSMTFSNATSLEDGYFELANILGTVQGVNRDVEINKVGWNDAKHKANSLDVLNRQEFLDTSVKAITNNAVNQDVLINNTGILLRKKEESGYAPDKLWLTSANILLYSDVEGLQLKEPRVAIGHVEFEKDGKWKEYYGVAADVIYGKLLWGENLYLTNDAGTMTFDQNGMVVTGKNNFSVKINPEKQEETFVIANGNTKLLYVDTKKNKLVFSGRLEADEGLIGGWTIGKTALTSGKVGMSSSTANNNIAFWAGNTTASSAPFKVTNNGALTCSNATITGGTLTIGENFKVEKDGKVTASHGIFSGSITATEGNIGGWDIYKENGKPYLDGGTTARIKGGIIQAGKNYEVGNERGYMLYANSEKVYLGSFEIKEYGGRYIIQSEEETDGGWVGMSPKTKDSTNRQTLWAGFHAENDTYDFVVKQSGTTAIKKLDAKSVTLLNTKHWDNYNKTGEPYTLAQALDYIWIDGEYGLDYCAGEIRSLQSQINSLKRDIENLWENLEDLSAQV